jgi:proteasome assembly chaperone (PAC2) family protein
MVSEPLTIGAQPRLRDGRMVLAFSGWMDGGDVSTGTLEWLAAKLDARQTGSIDPQQFYIYNFPGSMELSALFRPHTRIESGAITTYQPPTNTFYCSEEENLVLFQGKEPHFNWGRFADCIFTFAAHAGITTMYFVGSYGGTVPHTREPRLASTVSDQRLKSSLHHYRISFTDYEGPASFSTHLLTHAPDRGFRMASLVAEIPAYIQGTNPKCIEAVLRKLLGILGLEISLDNLRKVTDQWERRLNSVLEENPELASMIEKLEGDYDNEVFDTQMGDLKEWLQKKGIRLD